MIEHALRSTTRATMALAAVSVLSACGDDSTGVNTGSISEETSMELALELMGHMWGGEFGPEFSGQPGASFSILPAEPDFAETIEFSESCSDGGNVAVAGSMDESMDANGTGSVSIDIRQTPANCGLATSEGVFIVNGDPSIRFTAQMNFSEGEPVGDMSMGMSGGFNWSGSGETGRCAMNMSLTMNFSNPEQMSLSGSICGHALEG